MYSNAMGIMYVDGPYTIMESASTIYGNLRFDAMFDITRKYT